MTKKKTGTKEWAETTLNIARGCDHGCRYCYARFNLVDRFRIIDPKDWPNVTINQKAVDAGRGKHQGTVMIPSSHDIQPSILSEFIEVLCKLLDAGNQVLIVTKPHWECITTICDTFEEHKDQILFRFTIGSTDEDVLAFWEPGAPKFTERIASLQYAYERGFATSVSSEPYLDAYPQYIYDACISYITDSIWFGTIKHFNSRVDLEDATEEQVEKYVDPILKAQTPAMVKQYYKLLDGKPLVKWKETITEIVGR